MKLTVSFHNGGWFTADLINDHDLETAESLRTQWRSEASGPLEMVFGNGRLESTFEDIADVTIATVSR